jgi:hypothetical protein
VAFDEREYSEKLAFRFVIWRSRASLDDLQHADSLWMSARELHNDGCNALIGSERRTLEPDGQQHVGEDRLDLILVHLQDAQVGRQ